jgi:hypothetical protein
MHSQFDITIIGIIKKILNNCFQKVFELCIFHKKRTQARTEKLQLADVAPTDRISSASTQRVQRSIGALFYYSLTTSMRFYYVAKCILNFCALKSRQDENSFWNKQQQTFPELALFLISPWSSFILGFQFLDNVISKRSPITAFIT